MKKAIFTMVLVILLVFAVPLSAFAQEPEYSSFTGYLSLDKCYYYKNYQMSGPVLLDTANVSWLSSLGRLNITNPGVRMFGFSPRFTVQPVVTLKKYEYFIFDIDISGVTSSEVFGSNPIRAQVQFRFNEIGTSNFYTRLFEMDVTNDLEKYNLRAVIQIGDGYTVDDGYDLTNINFFCGVPSPSFGEGDYSINFDMKYAVEVNEDDKRHAQTLEAIDNAADQVTDKIDEATDEIVNGDLGYTTPSDQQNVMSGLDTLTSQVDELNAKVEEVKLTINDGSKQFVDGAKNFGNFINGIFSGLPVGFLGLITGLLIFLVIRKVVGR